MDLIEVESAGDCFYDAVAYYEYQFGTASHIKVSAMEELVKHKHLYTNKAELEYTATYDMEVDYLRGDRVEATSTVLHAMATVILRPLYVYVADTDPDKEGRRSLTSHRIEPSREEPELWGPPICLFNHQGVHFDRLISV